MTRSPHRTRPDRNHHQDHQDPIQTQETSIAPLDTRGQQEQLRLSQRLLQPIVPLGHEYTTDDEKRTVFADLIRLKAAGKTNKQAAELLGISERTVNNYRADALYHEIEKEMEADAKQRGYTTIAEIIPDALGVVYDILQRGKSEFVRFKSAELLLNYAGYGVPREDAQKSNREEVSRFFEILAAREQERQQHLQVNVQINHTLPSASSPDSPHSSEPMVVEADSHTRKSSPSSPPLPALEERGESGEDLWGSLIPPELQPYYLPLQPGGKLPEGFA